MSTDLGSPSRQDGSPRPNLYQSYHSQLENLKRLPVPYGDIYHALSAHDSIPLSALYKRFQSASSDLKIWLETAEMTVFGLQMDVGQEGATSKQDVGEIDVIMNRFQPNVDMLVELQERIESRIKAEKDGSSSEEEAVDQSEMHETTKTIKTSWSSLKTTLDRVKTELSSGKLRAELLTHMDNVLVDIDEICTKIDAFHSERSSLNATEEDVTSTLAPSSPPNSRPSSPQPSTASSSAITSTSTSTATATTTATTTPTDATTAAKEAESAKQRQLDTLADIDSRIELLISRIDFLDARVGSLPSDESSIGTESKDILKSRYQQVLVRWDDLKFRRERLSDELKEDRWLAVFDQVAEQVESMMESMERAIVHCQGLVDQIKNMVREKVVPSAPIDREHLYTIFKSFEAKHKYYAPAVTKMLDMLENGIESQINRNQDVIRRHQTMNVKWDKLSTGLEHVERELDHIDRYLDILDSAVVGYFNSPPMNPLPERTPFGTRRTLTPSDRLQAASPTYQSSQYTRGRQPGLRSPSPSHGAMRANGARSPRGGGGGDDPRYRAWSPLQPGQMSPYGSYSPYLSPNGLFQFRALSPDPSRSPTRGLSDKLRPWCPSTKPTSPGIPGIPLPPGPAMTAGGGSMGSGAGYLSPMMSMMSLGGAPSGLPRPSSRDHGATSPSMIKPPSSAQYKPPFSPGGSAVNSNSSHRQSRAFGSSPAVSPTPNNKNTYLPMPASHQTTSAAAARAKPKTAVAAPPKSMAFGSRVPPKSPSPSASSSGYGRQQAVSSGPKNGYQQQQQQQQRSSYMPTSPSPSAQNRLTPTRQRQQGFSSLQQQQQQQQQQYHHYQQQQQQPHYGYTSSDDGIGGHPGGRYSPAGSRRAPSTSSVSSMTSNSRLDHNGHHQQHHQNGGYSANGSSMSGGQQKMYSYGRSQRDSAYGSTTGSAPGSTSSVGPDAIRPSTYNGRPPTSPPMSPPTTASSITSPAAAAVARSRGGSTASPVTPASSPKGGVAAAGKELTEMVGEIHLQDLEPYVPTPADELDEQFAKVVNANPIQIKVRRLGEGKYYFGGNLEGQHLTGGKLVLCRLMEYSRSGYGVEDDSGVSSGESHSGMDEANDKQDGGAKKRRSKVVVRVGGGWQDLDIFLFDHSFLGNDNIIVRQA
ncbi:hypothetical protein DFQ26_008152 [Actinomortierella ambigua]|nr:hypothetical protein DFQ26_008152 [Actinomortierella ambigua]